MGHIWFDRWSGLEEGPLLKTKTLWGVFHFTCVNIFARRLPAGGGKAGPGRRLWLLHGEALPDGPELHTAAHPHPALHLRGRRLEGLLLVHRARRRQSQGMTCHPDPTVIWSFVLEVVVRTRRGLLVLWLPARQQNLHPNTGHIVPGLNVL